MARKTLAKGSRREMREGAPCPRGILRGEHPREFVTRIYSADFLQNLAALLRCPPFDVEKANEVRHMAFAYIIQANEEKPDPAKLRREYQQVGRISEQFIRAIEALRE